MDETRSALPDDAAASDAPDAPAADAATGTVDPEVLRSRVIDALKTCYDPEIPVDIYELGLIYEIDVQPAGAIRIRMTLTSPMCPVAESLPVEVREKVQKVPEVGDVEIDLVWEPAWDPSRMSEAARLELGF
jgi:FeS assembly SUF system protein